MGRLSSPVENIKDHYTVVVVGSGYGGSIAASRMARASQQVCLLERGKELQPGEYPETLAEAAEQMQLDTPEGHIGSRTGLYDLRKNDDLNVFMGCGLGGTSLVNANVSLRAEPRVFDDPRWPQEVRDDLSTLIEDCYKHAEDMLKPQPYPDDFPRLPKLGALEKSAAALNEKFYRPPINVTFKEGINHVGVYQGKCALSGDCVTGCNYGAKNTTLMNYLPDAKNHGAEIYTQVAVRRLERKDGRWLVHYQVLNSGREKFSAPMLFVSADIVILGAGALGSTEILLRSREAGLALSERLGHSLTGNGDVLAFAYNTDEEINAVGFGHHKPEEMQPVGPCITGVIDARSKRDLSDGMVIEEGSMPGPLAMFLPESLTLAARIGGTQEERGFYQVLREKAREVASLVEGAYHGAVHNTQICLVMTHDDGNGRMQLVADRLRIDWPGVGSQPIFQKVDEKMEKASRVLGGVYTRDPLWSKLLGRGLITVHPLGGCSMGEDAERGVVNHKGQLFSGIRGKAVYENLYVADGAVIPRPLGVNPLLTISCLAERCCALIARDRDWTINYAWDSQPIEAGTTPKAGVEFTETMRGYLSTKVVTANTLDDYKRASELGEQENSPFEFTLTIASDDLDQMLTDQQHDASMVGTVKAPALSPEPLTVTNGVFNLFVDDPSQVEVKLMKYRMKLSSEEGKTFYFEGFKVVRKHPLLDVWPDTSTLYITVYSGDSPASPVIGMGLLRIVPADFARQLTTMKITNAPNAEERLKGMARFGGFFGDVLFQTYGSVFANSMPFNPDAPPRKKRPLEVDAPELHPLATRDQIPLLLSRYKGGDKGPVILSHGLGVSSLIFSIDTIETNLLEYLFAHGYDVWLLDYRASIALPSAYQASSADDIAALDYPAAVAKVRDITGAQTVQMVAHCYGSTTFFMAMLAGLQGVRSAVCSQIASDVRAVPLTRFKSGIHAPEVLAKLGVPSLTAYVTTHADWKDRLFDEALKLYPLEVKERCHSDVCHRITFLYSLLYEHAQLNEATHDALHEMFGVANIKALEHLAHLVRAGHLVDFDGREVYMPHLDRLAIPISFIHGAQNQCFLPESTAITYEALRAKNGQYLYARHVISGYGHIDCIFGKNAVKDVYPFILQHLEETANPQSKVAVASVG